MFMGIPVRWVGEQIWLIDSETRLTPYQVFSGENKIELIELISFCRQGGFWTGTPSA
jgi:hypothetical protein